MFKYKHNRKHSIKAAAVAGVFAMAAAYADLPDPTRPPNVSYTDSSAEAAEDKIFLSTILISPERRVAVINGKALRKGDPVGAGHILEIKPSEVVLKVGTDTEILSLLPRTLKVRTRKAGYE